MTGLQMRPQRCVVPEQRVHTSYPPPPLLSSPPPRRVHPVSNSFVVSPLIITRVIVVVWDDKGSMT